MQQVGSSIDPERQMHAFAHSINLDPTGRFAFSADLGADKLFSYRFDADKGLLTANDPPFITTPAGSGPRHFVFDRAGRFCYLVTEMGGTVIVYQYDASKGAMKQLQICSLLPADYKGTNSSAEVQIDPTGKFLYASNRLHTDFLTIFSVDPSSGLLKLVGYQPTGGKTPRNFRIDPSGKFLIAANQDSDNIVLFRIDTETGKLKQVGEPIHIPRPQCVKFVSVTD
jgi:6-phosphogluconolactonase